tara:strand:+ start:171 stop:974 length:804 start_codon:yes stop_codon:yes gene_type:complete
MNDEEELQQEELDTEEASEELETPKGLEEDSDSAPEDDQEAFSPLQQERFNAAIGKKVRQTRDQERRADDLERQLQEIKSQLPKQERPYVPPVPDPFSISDEEYRRTLAQRDEAVKAAVNFDNQRQAQLQAHQRLQEQQAQEQHATQNEKILDYSKRASKLGIKAEELQVAGNSLANYGIDESLGQFILEDAQGPLITTYLAANPQELDELRSMSPAKAAAMVESQIRGKAVAARPKKVTDTPDPLERPRGAGKPPKGRGPQGATFE